MSKVIKNELRCDNAPYCGAKRHCLSNAILYDENKREISIDSERCIGCGICVRACPRAALELK